MSDTETKIIEKKPRSRQRSNFKNRLNELEERIGSNNENEEEDDSSLVRSQNSDENKSIIQSKKKRSRDAIKSKLSTIKSGQENEAFELEELKTTNKLNEEITAKPRRQRQNKTATNKQPEMDQHPSSNDTNILAIIVHKTDKLRTEINLYNPVVRIHILDLETDGEYVAKTKKERNVLFYYEKTNRPINHISPIMTTPFNFKENRSTIPRWEEIVVFNEEFSHFIKEKPNCLIIFEILDSRSPPTQQKYTSGDTSKSWMRVAWAFLKIVGTNKNQNIEKKLRLQLYYSQDHYKVNEVDSLKPEIYELFKHGPRVKYPASLHVTVKSILPPKTFTPTIGSLYYLEHEQFIQNIENDNMTSNINANTSSDEAVAKQNEQSEVESNDIINAKTKTTIWSRIAGLPCRIPNDKALSLNATKNGCYSLKFSRNGNFIACGCVEENNLSPVYVYTIPDGRLVMKYHGHFGLIYEIDWSKSDKYIVTASNDATARIIDIESRSKDPFKILPHPTFIYTAKFHPTSLDIICTAGYDKVIRIWTCSGSKKKASKKYGELLQELFGHSGYINSICFSLDGFTLYSGDSAGSIKSWNAYIDKDSSKHKEWELKNDFRIDEIKNQSINVIHLHPNQFRLLIHLRDNQIKLIDLRLDTVIQRYKGIHNFNQNLRSAISACGTFLFASGSDNRIHIWNVDTGDNIENVSIHLNYLKPVRDICFHPYDNFIAFCSFDINASIYMFKFNSEKAANDINLTKTNVNTVDLNTGRLTQTIETSSTLKENALKAKLADDIAKFNAYQANRWKSVQEKLDSVYPKSEISASNNRNLAAEFINSSITLSVVDQKNKPEFKYKGPKEAQEIVVVLYDYKAQRSDELDLAKGDEIQVLVKENENWWMGELIKTKQEGYFPASYVQDKSVFDLAKKNAINPIKMPKYTVRDALVEYEKTYESKALNSISRIANQSNSDSKAAQNYNDVLKKDNQSGLSNLRSILTNKDLIPQTIISNVNRENLLNNSQNNVEIINEVPTRDINKPKDTINRRTFSHLIINGSHQTSSKI